MTTRWLRRLAFRVAFRGCKVDDPKALEFAAENLADKSLESEIVLERALVLEYWARRILRDD